MVLNSLSLLTDNSHTQNNSIVSNPFIICSTDNDDRHDNLYNPDMNCDGLRNANVSCQYYSDEQFIYLLQEQPLHHSSGSGSLSSLHLNVRSLPRNYDHLTYLFTLNHSFSVMAFSETWLKGDITGLYPFSQYNAFHSSRKNEAGGGVSIYLLDKYNCIQKRDVS